MFWTDRTSSAVCAPTVPGKTAASSRKARRNMQLYSFIPFELVIGKRVIGASAEKFRSEDQSIKLTEASNSLPSLSLTSPSITHKTGPLRQAVFKLITIHFSNRRRLFPGICAWAVTSSGGSGTLVVAANACIDHKSLEICDRCRLWPQTSPATPKIPLLFFEMRVQTGCLDFRTSITALKVTRSVSLRAF